MALYPHVQQALASDSAGLNVEAVVKDERIREADLRVALEMVSTSLGRHLPEGALSRRNLAQALAQAIDDAISIPRDWHHRGETVINPTAPWQEDIDNSAVRPQFKHYSVRIAGPTADVTNRILHQLRIAQGWVPLFRAVPHIKTSRVRQLADELRASFVGRAIGRGLTPEAAEKEAQQNYIAVTQHYKSSWKDGNVEFDYRHPTTRSVDLSPKAVEDLHKAVREKKDRRSFAREQCLHLRDLCRRWHIGGSAESPRFQGLLSVLYALRDREIERGQAKGLSPEEAVRQAADTYIDIGRHGDSGRIICVVFPRALPDIDRKLQRLWRERRPDTPSYPSQ